MKGDPIIYVPINPEDEARKRLQLNCLCEFIEQGWRTQGVLELNDGAGEKVKVQILRFEL